MTSAMLNFRKSYFLVPATIGIKSPTIGIQDEVAIAIQTSMNPAKFDALEEYRTSPLFTEAEHASLDYVTELTKNRAVNPNTFGRLARRYSERQVCGIVWLVASEHFYNMTNKA